MRILFVTSTRIGDAVLSTGVLGWLLDTYPGASVTVACGAAPAPLFRTAPGVERVLPIVKRRRGAHWLSLWASVAGRRWDVVVDLRGSAIAWMLAARKRIVHRPDPSLRHRVVQLSELIGAQAPVAPRLWIAEDAQRAAATLLPSGGPILALGPTANWNQKRWPNERFAALALRLTGANGPLAQARIAVFGAPAERKSVEPLLRSLPPERTVDLVGAIELEVASACLAGADLFVGNDSGLMHIAAAAGTPTLGLFGPSRTEHYAPWGTHAASVRTPEPYEELARNPIFEQTDGESLMSSLGVDMVETAARRLLQAVRMGSPPRTSA